MFVAATRPAAASAMAVLVAGAIVLALHDLGPVSAHMTIHIALMNVAAPLIVAAWPTALPGVVRRVPLWLAAMLQLLLLWAWHAPPLHHAAMHSALLQVAMHGSLLIAALAFWNALHQLAPQRRWRALPALLITGKLVCLLGALLIFAPRFLYGGAHASGIEGAGLEADLADQQLAGLLMVTACPLSYLVAGIVQASQFLASLAAAPAAPQTSRG